LLAAFLHRHQFGNYRNGDRPTNGHAGGGGRFGGGTEHARIAEHHLLEPVGIGPVASHPEHGEEEAAAAGTDVATFDPLPELLLIDLILERDHVGVGGLGEFVV